MMQFVSYSDPRMARLLTAFESAESEPMDLNEMTLCLQGIIEAGMAGRLDLAVYRAAVHFNDVGLCTATGRMLQ